MNEVIHALQMQLRDIERQLHALQRLDVTPPPSSLVTYSGTPTAGRLAQWTGAGTVEQTSYAGSAVTRYSGVPTAGAIAYWTANGTVTAAGFGTADVALLAGRAGGQTLKGGTAASEDLTLESTNHATKGDVYIQPNGGNVGIGFSGTTQFQLHVEGASALGLFRRINEAAANRAPALLLVRTRGTPGSEADIVAGDQLGKVQFRGRVASADAEYGGIAMVASDTSRGGYYAFLANDVATPVVVIQNSNGSLGIGANAVTPAAQLHVWQNTLGSEVLRLQSTATGDDPTEQVIHGRVATTNNTTTTLLTIPIGASETLLLDLKVVGRRTGGSAGTANDSFGEVEISLWNVVSGVTTKLGTMLSHYVSSTGSGVISTSASGSNIVVEVTGLTNYNITWHAYATIRKLST